MFNPYLSLKKTNLIKYLNYKFNLIKLNYAHINAKKISVDNEFSIA